MSSEKLQKITSSIFQDSYQAFQSEASNVLNDYLKNFNGNESVGEVLVYSLVDAGKLLRPVMIAAMAEAFCVDKSKIRPLQLAIELVHASSLIHDDLPALDNDDVRRGKPSCHKVFGEGLALLVGDFMLAEASRVILEAEILEEKRIPLGINLSNAISAMCEGQILDLDLRDKQEYLSSSSLEYRLELLELINLKKTGALFEFCVFAPSILIDGSMDNIGDLKAFHRTFSLLFQLCDDLLDSKHDTKEGVYRELNYVDILGASEAVSYADHLAANAKKSLSFFGERAGFLLDMIDTVRAAAKA